MAIVYSTSFTGIAADQALEAYDANWVIHPTTTYGYAGSTENGGSVYAKGASQVCMMNAQGAGALTDCHVAVRFVHSTGGTSIASTAVLARSDPTVRSHYGARIASGNFELFKRTNGTNVVLASVASGKSIPYDFVLGVKCVGNQIYLTVDGVDTLGPITDNSFASGYPGLYATGVSAGTNAILMDDFTVDNLGAPPDPTPPQGTTTITDVAPGTTSALVTYSYSAGDATGFEYRLNGGTAASIGASPATVSGLTASTTYSIEIRAINATGAGAWSAVANFTTEAEGPGNLPPSFDGPSIAAISATEGVALSALDVSSRFSDAESALTFSAVGSWPAGVTVSSAGVISGTPTTAGTYSGLQVRATDAGALTADSNTFSITVAAAALPSTITVGSALYPIKYTSESVLNESGLRATVLDATTLAEVLNTSGVVCASGVITITDPALVTGSAYHLVVKTAAGWIGISDPVTAS